MTVKASAPSSPDLAILARARESLDPFALGYAVAVGRAATARNDDEGRTALIIAAYLAAAPKSFAEAP